MVVVTKARLFLIEFKFDDSAQKAASQINQKKYYEKYLGMGKLITLAGIAFNYSDKNLELTFVQKVM